MDPKRKAGKIIKGQEIWKGTLEFPGSTYDTYEMYYL